MTTLSGRRTSPERNNKQKNPVLFLRLSISASSQGQEQEIMAAPDDGIQDPYLASINISTLEHLKLYNKVFFGLSVSNRYDLIRSKWDNFYQ